MKSFNREKSIRRAESREKMLEKMEYVFRIFKENKDEVALLWRPHPLIKATVQSMRPALWTEYEKLVKRYLEEGWGIYDDTADVDRAIALNGTLTISYFIS